MTWALAKTDKGITYSMEGARDGSDGTMDCSGFVLEALRQVGVDVPLTNTVGMLWRTDTFWYASMYLDEPVALVVAE